MLATFELISLKEIVAINSSHINRVWYEILIGKFIMNYSQNYKNKIK